MAERRLAVLGQPIAHSKSPLLHGAAYRELGLDWSYERVEMTGEGLGAFLGRLGAEWRGLSLTMPVKHDIMPFLGVRHELVRLTGVANTALLDGGVIRGFNTDVHGIVAAFREAGVEAVTHAQILGGGATASSAIVAASLLGARQVTLSVRSPQRAMQLLDLGPLLGIRVDIEQLGEPLNSVPDAVISTLPNGADLDMRLAEPTARHSVLLDVAYDPWPTTLASAWQAGGGRVISGLEMLLHQAVMQVRIFTGGDPETPLPEESVVIRAMRDAVAAPSL
ncbi:shikimate dehydrogenase [Salinibacterium sp. SYSU T00001]|uniref:shikimate dehydrogenase n=1 Tax=Homoserinimonas sedimenticola TaxID=2986805 RepID=UPI002236A2DE|nr:shikimate dehydrogenase [Salinibacterium sedimenticola]MCW4384334.1 shikimate dehydrogenase [Salinibacterium sedimenticola]